MTVVTAITRDDSRFDSIKDEEWFKNLPDLFWRYWNELTIESKGLINCDNCNDLALGYVASVTNSGGFTTSCNECIGINILKAIAGMDWRFVWNTSLLVELVPFIVLPEHSAESLAIELLKCPRCTKSILPEDATSIPLRSPQRYLGYLAIDSAGNTVKVHDNCRYECNECNTSYVMGGTHGVEVTSVNNRWVCTPCWDNLESEDSWINCDSCDTYVTENNNYYSDMRDQNLCRSCYDSGIECQNCGYEYYEDDGHECDEDESGSRWIHSYGFKPRPIFFGSAPYHLGLELEVEARCARLTEGAEIMYDAVGGRAYLKYDGSLSNGFEIVTHPHSLSEIQDKFPWDAVAKIQDLGFRSWNTSSCGIHVHVSRSAFKDDAHQIKFTKLIYDNQRQVERLAGRKSNYAKFNDKGKVVAKVKYGNQSDGRYSAVNNENENTLEVRVFRGSLRKERILSAVEFVHAAVEYTKTIKVTPKDKPLSWARFIAFVVMHHEVYPNLITIMNELFDKDNEVIDQEEVNN